MVWRRSWRRAAPALLSLLIVGLAASWLVGTFIMRPSPSYVAPAVAPASDLRLRASDGLTIAATYWPAKAGHGPAVLLLHGNGASREAEASTAAWLAGQALPR